ncbi:MAG TPA: zinc ribbon domain-containing protein, partial [Ktedonobacteraceae bacterium]|nr:zinc ribbon domain-containing protein [Ktedonobacteraceae bacterium]
MQGTCANCGELLIPGGRFCEICGTPVENLTEGDRDRSSLASTSTSGIPDTTAAPSSPSFSETTPFTGEDATTKVQPSAPVWPTSKPSIAEEFSSPPSALTTSTPAYTPEHAEEPSVPVNARPDPVVWKSP